MADGSVESLELRKPLLLDDGRELYPLPGDSVSNRSEPDSITVDGYRHELYTSQPLVATENPPYIMVYPGYFEHAAHGIGKKFHRTVARFIPNAHVIGVATDGFGPDSERFGFDDRDSHNLEAMGRSRASIIEEIVPPEAPIIFVVTSMGNIILKEVARNLPDSRLEHVAGGVLNACALVEQGPEDDKLAHLRSFGKFLFSMVPDIGVEVVRTPPNRMVSQLMSLVDSGHLSRDDALPLSLLLKDILSGSKTADIDLMLEKFHDAPFGVLIGENDPVGEIKKWRARQPQHPNLSVHPVPGRSHAIVVNPVRNGRAVSRILYNKHVVSPLALAA